MFQVGDKVFYPMYGAGVIEAIEEKEIQGVTREYCMITIPLSKMNVMIPMKNMEKIKIRSVVDTSEAKEILVELQGEEPHGALPWKERLKRNTEKMKTGEMKDTAEVFHDLVYYQKEKALNSSEKHMLDLATKFLVSEIALVKDISENEAAHLLQLTS